MTDDRADPGRIATKRDFGRELSLAKELAGVTVRDIARAVGTPTSTIGGYLSGKHLPAPRPPELLARVLAVCGITDEATIDRWAQAVRRARRAGGEQGSPTSTVDVEVVGPARPASAPALPRTAEPSDRPLPASIRPPVDRLVQAPTVRGRDELLDQLRARDAERPVIVLHGLGGIGKSTIALTLAREALAAGRRCWWVSSADPDSVEAGMQALAVELGASLDQIRMGSSPDLVWRLLEACPEPWLLIVDNADDPPGVLALPGAGVVDGTGWLRNVHSGLGTVVVTSRDGGSGSWGDPPPPWLELVAVRPLEVADGTRVLHELAGAAGGPVEEAQRLAARLGGLPLALYLAGRHIAEAASIPAAFAGPDAARTFERYRLALDEGRHDEVLGTPDSARAAGPVRAVFGRTWELSLDLLADRGLPLARPLLRVLSCLGPAPVPCGLLLRPEVLSESPLFGPVSGRLVWDLLRSLAGLGVVDLLETDRADPELALLAVPHPLVRETSRKHPDVRTELSAYLALTTALIAAAAADLDPKDPRTWARWRALVDHSNSPLDLVQEFHIGPRAVPPGMFRAATLAARFLKTTGELARAEAAYARAVRLAATVLDPGDPRLLDIEHDLSRVWYDLGRLSSAANGLRAVLKRRSQVLGPTHPDTLTTQHYLARTLRDAGQVDAAYRMFRKTLDARRAVLGADHPDTLASRNNAADALRALGHLDQAADELQAVLDLRITLLGPEHPATLVSRYNLARLARDRDDLTGARKDLGSLLETYERALGPDHPRTLLTRQALVDVLHDLGEFGAAEAAARELLERRRATLGDHHPGTLVTRHRLGLVLLDLGELAAAETELVAVLAARRLVLGSQHPDTVLARESLDALRSRTERSYRHS